MSASDTVPAPAPDNPLLSPSPLPFELPPFADLTLEHCREALLAGMAEQRAEVAALVASAEPPTFENTIVALERSGRLLGRAEAVFYNLASSVSTVVQASRELFGNTLGPPPSDAWSMQHAALYSVLWAAVFLALFVPLAVRAYRRAAAR